MNAQTRNAKETTPGAAPMRGSFPLDRLHECDAFVEAYFRCLKRNNSYAPKCRKEVREYLLCRKDKHLSTEEDLKEANLPPLDAEIPEFNQDEWIVKTEKQKKSKLSGIPGAETLQYAQQQQRQAQQQQNEK